MQRLPAARLCHHTQQPLHLRYALCGLLLTSQRLALRRGLLCQCAGAREEQGSGATRFRGLDKQSTIAQKCCPPFCLLQTLPGGAHPRSSLQHAGMPSLSFQTLGPVIATQTRLVVARFDTAERSQFCTCMLAQDKTDDSSTRQSASAPAANASALVVARRRLRAPAGSYVRLADPSLVHDASTLTPLHHLA